MYLTKYNSDFYAYLRCFLISIKSLLTMSLVVIILAFIITLTHELSDNPKYPILVIVTALFGLFGSIVSLVGLCARLHLVFDFVCFGYWLIFFCLIKTTVLIATSYATIMATVVMVVYGIFIALKSMRMNFEMDQYQNKLFEQHELF